MVGVLTAVLPAVVAVAPAARGAAVRDTVTVSGYDYLSERPADVIAASADNNLVFRYVAATAVTDATMTIDVPAADWPTPLSTRLALSGDPSEDGSVVVRPAPPFDPGPGDCTGTATSSIGWTVINAATSHRIVVQHLTCLPGQQIAVRVFGIAAPVTTGKYAFAVSVSDAAGAHRVPAAKLSVVPPPRIRLEVTAPASPVANTPVPILVRALNPSGRVDTSYRGGVALLSEDEHDCSFEGYEDRVYDFTAADAGTHILTVVFDTWTSHRLEAYDVAHRALPGESDPYQVVGDSGLVDCPVSFH